MDFIYVNENGESIELNSTSSFLVKDYEGLDGAKNIITSQKNYNSDGEEEQGESLDKRNITIQGYIKSSSLDELERKIEQLYKIFSPKKQGTLYATRRNNTKKINCKIERLSIPRENKWRFHPFIVYLTALNPYFTDEDGENRIDIARWVGDFEFPVEITDEFEFGHREPSLIVNVNNSGDVECGMRVEFKALGTVTNPSIVNIDTQEFIKINKTMVAGEVITVTTYDKNKRVESTVNNVTSNIFNDFDIDSTFIKLDPGDNLFRYDAAENIDSLEISIYYDIRYVGV